MDDMELKVWCYEQVAVNNLEDRLGRAQRLYHKMKQSWEADNRQSPSGDLKAYFPLFIKRLEETNTYTRWIPMLKNVILSVENDKRLIVTLRSQAPKDYDHGDALRDVKFSLRDFIRVRGQMYDAEVEIRKLESDK